MSPGESDTFTSPVFSAPFQITSTHYIIQQLTWYTPNIYDDSELSWKYGITPVGLYPHLAPNILTTPYQTQT